MKFNLRGAINTLAKKDLKFLQPLYEAITNSLEANATRIIIDIFCDEETLNLQTIKPKISGFSVTDNGEGFAKENIESFLELWTDRKIEFGCKGSGRFTWLSVFKNITIKSEVASENKLVIIPFNINFNDNDIEISDGNFTENKTKIVFTDVTDRYLNSDRDGREVADIDIIKSSIEQNLLIKLFLLKNKGEKFLIQINLKDEQRKIDESTISNLSLAAFDICSDLTEQTFAFKLYYHFVNDGKNSKKIYFCANDRVVKENDDASDFSCPLPNQMSFDMLLCSEYLDEAVNDSRDDFPVLLDRKNADIFHPLLFKDIKLELIKQIHLILLKKFPELDDLNKEQEEKAINASPYLTKYIRENSDIIKTENSLTTKAINSFNKHKITTKKKFEELLKKKDIDATSFNEAVAELSEVAVAELGEYILYRDSIIKALQDATHNTAIKERFIHNIFIPMNFVTNNSTDYSLTNMWLLDDKFMSFSNAFSDVQIKKILDKLFRNSFSSRENIRANAKRPDVAIFYNKDIGRDALVVEFKGLHASLSEKETSLTELSRNCLLLKKKVKEIDTIWGYIITTIDEDFNESLEATGYKRIFSNDSSQKAYYFYNENVGGHFYVLDINTIISDAFARNKSFLEILKHSPH